MSETTRSRVELEEMARQAVKAAPGCTHVIDVDLAYTGTSAKRPNWRLIGTTPPLPPGALIDAHMAVEKLSATYLMVDG